MNGTRRISLVALLGMAVANTGCQIAPAAPAPPVTQKSGPAAASTPPTPHKAVVVRRPSGHDWVAVPKASGWDPAAEKVPTAIPTLRSDIVLAKDASGTFRRLMILGLNPGEYASLQAEGRAFKIPPRVPKDPKSLPVLKKDEGDNDLFHIPEGGTLEVHHTDSGDVIWDIDRSRLYRIP